MLTKNLWHTLLITLMVVLAAGVVAAADPPTDCTTNGEGNWYIEANGPYYGLCPDTGTGDCSFIDYTITSNFGLNADHVFTLVRGAEVVKTTSVDLYDLCVGSNVIPIGFLDCSAQAIRVNPDPQTSYYTVVVKGQKIGVTSSFAVKSGRKAEEACAIVGLGGESPINPKAAINTTEIVKFEECSVKVEKSPVTGKVLSVALTEESVLNECEFFENDLSQMQVSIIGDNAPGDLQGVQYAEGQIATGSESCTTYIIGGKLYTFGKPCP